MKLCNDRTGELGNDLCRPRHATPAHSFQRISPGVHSPQRPQTAHTYCSSRPACVCESIGVKKHSWYRAASPDHGQFIFPDCECGQRTAKYVSVAGDRAGDRTTIVNSVAVNRNADRSSPMEPATRAGQPELLRRSEKNAEREGRVHQLSRAEHRGDSTRVVECSRSRSVVHPAERKRRRAQDQHPARGLDQCRCDPSAAGHPARSSEHAAAQD